MREDLTMRELIQEGYDEVRRELENYHEEHRDNPRVEIYRDSNDEPEIGEILLEESEDFPDEEYTSVPVKINGRVETVSLNCFSNGRFTDANLIVAENPDQN